MPLVGDVCLSWITGYGPLKNVPSVEGEVYLSRYCSDECIRSMAVWAELRIINLAGIQIVHKWNSRWNHTGVKFLDGSCLNRQAVNMQLSMTVNLTESDE